MSRLKLLTLFVILAFGGVLVASCTTPRGGEADHPLEADPSQVDFGYVPSLQFSQEVMIEITNAGTSSVEVQQPRISEGSADAFALQLLPAVAPFSLGAGQSETISAYFAPPASGTYLGWIEIITDADTDGPFLVALGGCSTDPECTVEFVEPDPGDDDDDVVDDDDDATDDDDDASGPQDIDIDPVAFDFGTVHQNQAPIGDVLVISNTGGEALEVTSLSITGPDADYFGMGGWSGGVIQPNAAPVNLNINFDPVGAPLGPKSATLTVNSDDPDEGSLDIAMTANVDEDCGACPPELSVVGGTPLDVFVGQILYVQVSTGTVDVEVSNIGSGNLSVEPISEGGEFCTDNPAISYESGAPSQLAPGESATLTFSVGQEGLEVVNFGGTYAFTLGTVAADPTAILEYALSAPNCDLLGM